VHDRAVAQRPGVAVQLACRASAAALVLVEACQPVEHVLQRADLTGVQGAGFERGQR
jgi:hypothetical protein